MGVKQISQSFHQLKSCIHLTAKRVGRQLKYDKKTRAITAAVLVLMIFCSVWFQITGAEVYSLTIGGKEAGYITDQSLVKEAVVNVGSNYEDDGIEAIIDESAISCKPTKLKKNDVQALSLGDLEKAIEDSEFCTAKGWTINVEGKNIVAVTSEQAAHQALEDVKSSYLTNGSKVISASFKENVLVTQSAVRIADLRKQDEAEKMLLTGEQEPKLYEVQDGDTLWDIAAANGMSIAELENANPGFDPDTLKIGQQLNLLAVNPYVTVQTKELITTEEKIDFNTVYEETNTLNKNEIKIKTPGTYGSKQVSAEVTKENGVITATNVVESTVTAEPKDQVALKGTKVTYVASRGGGRAISVDASGSEIVSYAKTLIGTPYVHGGSSPKGFDCSGFTQYVYAHFGGNLPRTSAGQYGCGTFVDKSQLQPGDLVFFKSSSRISHVGIYVGGGSFIHSPQAGDKVKISNFSSTTLRYAGAVRASN